MNAMLRFIAWTLALALVALPVVAVVNGWVGAERFPLRKLRVTSQFERVDPQLLRQTVMPYAKQGFFAVQLDDAQNAVSKLPWVDRAEVRKHWPDVLEIRLIEHAPFARWGKDRLLSQQGRLLPIKGIDVPKGLPQLDGPDTRTADVVALYNESKAMFASTGVDVLGIALDPRGSWSLTLGNAAQVVVGRGDEDARLRLSRFSRLLPRLLAQQQRPLRRADLRYTNGFALSWGDAPPPAAAVAPSTPPTASGSGSSTPQGKT